MWCTQGGPLPPSLFNIAINFIYNEICDSNFANKHGYNPCDESQTLCLTGYADDQAITACSVDSAVRVINATKTFLLSIGLEINISKCNAIVIQQGTITHSDLQLSFDEIIPSISKKEIIKYLGCSFNDELLFNTDSLKPFNENLEKLAKSPLLKPNQKLNIINQYIFPSLVYPLQTAPLIKIPLFMLEGLDVIIRRTVKEIISLPDRTASAMFYAPRKLRGLGLVNCTWEAPLQHLSIASKLNNYDDPLFLNIFNFDQEKEDCFTRLNIPTELRDTFRSSRQVRKHLRQLSFEQ